MHAKLWVSDDVASPGYALVEVKVAIWLWQRLLGVLAWVNCQCELWSMLRVRAMVAMINDTRCIQGTGKTRPACLIYASGPV